MKQTHLIIGFIFLSCTPTYSQLDSMAGKQLQHIFFITGLQKNSFYSGGSIGFGYQYHIKETYLSFLYQYSEEFLLFGGTPQKATEVSALYNFELGERKILSVGGGLGYTIVVADSYNILGPPLSGSNNRPSQIKKSVLGFPINMNFIIPSKRRFTAGLNLHANFNSVTNLYDGCFFLRCRLG